MRVILLGAPGSGKGTVGDRVSEATGFHRISTGDLLRDAVRKDTPLGRRAKDQMGRGGLVDDALVLELLGERLAAADARDGYILDGYPRNLDQARCLEGLDGKRAEVVFLIETGEDVVVERLSGRRVCPNCGAVYNLVTKKTRREGMCDVCGAHLVQRQDDRPEVIRERMRTYRTQTEPLVAYYQAKGDLHKVDGNGSVEETFAPIKSVLARMPAGSGRVPRERS
jgi:adenylate kinase